GCRHSALTHSGEVSARPALAANASTGVRRQVALVRVAADSICCKVTRAMGTSYRASGCELGGHPYHGGMGKALLVMIVLVLAVYSIFDVIAAPRQQVRGPSKWLWLPIALVPVLGALLWLVFGKVHHGSSPPPPPSHRPTPRGPDDDPDFLRGL